MVCGMKVGEGAPSSKGPGGQLFFFCCSECRAYFGKCMEMAEARWKDPETSRQWVTENRCWLTGSFKCTQRARTVQQNQANALKRF